MTTAHRIPHGILVDHAASLQQGTVQRPELPHQTILGRTVE